MSFECSWESIISKNIIVKHWNSCIYQDHVCHDSETHGSIPVDAEINHQYFPTYSSLLENVHFLELFFKCLKVSFYCC